MSGMEQNTVEGPVLEKLGRVASIRTRRMFGCVGVYSDDLFFAIVDGPSLYFKVDDGNRPAYEAQGMGPFTPHATGKRIPSFYGVPSEVLDRPDALGRWAAEAIDAANRKREI